MECDPSIQISCFAKPPDAVMVDTWDRKSRGRYIPNSVHFKLEMSHDGKRGPDLSKLRACVVNSLRQGDNAYVHCMTELARAPMAAAILCCILMDLDLDDSMDRIDRLRNVQFDKMTRNIGR